ncbi:hypothetical protein PENSPDRAFT_656339 [Peniophora sp. CONT]|nr:hypothetical protein PENSPDRAFT_656339 [Peniophora sp. CONT]
MDHGSQNYHSLSHALHPPSIRPADAYANAGYPPSAYQTNSGSAQKRANDEEEEDEEDEAVEEELEYSKNSHTSHGGAGHPQPATSTSGQDSFIHHPASSSATQSDGQSEKRRPGRPKGSKNRKPRDSPTATKQPQYPTPSTAAPSIPGMPAQNQQYYEFQWRVLNLCSEFYGAAEELIKGTPPSIIQQTYQHGPAAKVNPMEMLNEARRVCDELLANPQQLVGKAPPVVYNPYSAPSAPAPSAAPTASGSKPPQYGIPLQPAYYAPGTAYPGYAPGAAYYPYPYPATYSMPPPSATPAKHDAPASAPLPVSRQPTPASAPAPMQALQAAPAPAPAPAPPASTSASAPPPATASASGTWADDEIEKLKRLAEQSKGTNSMGDVNWDWVVQSWGPSRSRHQILLKATSLGLKESTTRPNQKRKREDNTGEPELRAAPAPPSAQPSLALPPPVLSGPGSAPPPPQMPAPTQNSNTSSPATRPASGSAMRPLSASTITRPASGSVSTSNPPWPMPVVASGASPVNIQVSPRQDARLPPVTTAAGAYSFPGGRPPTGQVRYAVFPSQGAQGSGTDGR